MTVSAFGVYHPDEIAKGGRFSAVMGNASKKHPRLRRLAQSGAESLQRGVRSTAADEKTHGKTLRETPKAVGEKMAEDSPFGGAFESLKRVRDRVSAVKASNAEAQRKYNHAHTRFLTGKSKTDPKPPQKQSESILDNANIGDVVRAANVKRTDVKPENVLRGKKTTTTNTNVLTGVTEQHVKREGNRFFNPMKRTTVNGEETLKEGGGLTGQGKTVLVGGPAAAAGLGGIALNERKKKNDYVY